jgi:hypothetical protein
VQFADRTTPARSGCRSAEPAASCSSRCRARGGTCSSIIAAARRLADGPAHSPLRRSAERRRPDRRVLRHEHVGVRPTRSCWQGLANGLPIGCLLIRRDAPEDSIPGPAAHVRRQSVTCAAAPSAPSDRRGCDVPTKGHRSPKVWQLPGVRSAAPACSTPARPAGGCRGRVRGRGLLVRNEDVLRCTPPLIVTTLDRTHSGPGGGARMRFERQG